MPNDGGHILTKNERTSLISNNSSSSKFIKPLTGANEFLKSIKRYCLWIDDSNLGNAKKIKEINKELKK